MSLQRNNLTNLRVLSRIKPFTVESLNLESNHIEFLDLEAIEKGFRLREFLVANNELQSLDVPNLVKHFPRLKHMSVVQRNVWLCSDYRRMIDILRQAKIDTAETVQQSINKDAVCFEPQHELSKLRAAFAHKYQTLLLVFGCTTTLLCAIIATLGVLMRRSLRRMRADSISKSFDIKIMQPALPPLPPENVYTEENVYNHVYSDPNPTTTL